MLLDDLLRVVLRYFEGEPAEAKRSNLSLDVLIPCSRYQPVELSGPSVREVGWHVLGADLIRFRLSGLRIEVISGRSSCPLSPLGV